MTAPTPPVPADIRLAAAAARVAHDDLVVFLNAAFACTGQREFYSDGHQQTVSIAFLHDYIRGNYRRLYARSLAAGINHFNQGRVVHELLTHHRGLADADRREEGRLIAAALAALPPHTAVLTAGLLDSPTIWQTVHRAGPLRLTRFLGELHPDREGHIGLPPQTPRPPQLTGVLMNHCTYTQ